MGLSISFLIMLPVIAFWSLVTFDILKEKGSIRKKALSVLFLMMLMASPLFSEYQSQQLINQYQMEKECENIQQYDTDFESFLLTDANNNSIMDITKKNGN